MRYKLIAYLLICCLFKMPAVHAHTVNPKAIMEAPIMVDLLVDIALLKATIYLPDHEMSVQDTQKDLAYQQALQLVYNKYAIKEADLIFTFNYYLNHLAQLKHIYEQVILKLENLLQTLD